MNSNLPLSGLRVVDFSRLLPGPYASLVLADKFGLFDIRWFYDWWPVLILLIGVYFIGSWIWEKMKASQESDESSFD